MPNLYGYCGAICSECPAYIATQAGDKAALQRVADEWRVLFNAPSMTIDDVTCDGCVGEAGRHGGYCPECDIRACGLEHGVITCAHCDEYGCAKVEHMFTLSAKNKQVLEAIRAELGH